MVRIIKNKVQQQLINQCRKKYDAQLELQQVPYKHWICTHEGRKKDVALCPNPENIKETVGTKEGLSYRIIPMEQYVEGFSNVENMIEDIVIFVYSKGMFADFAVNLIIKQFALDTKTKLLYGDEDQICMLGRVAPFFKPDYSPDTLLSFFYFGNCIAIRTDLWKEISLPVSNDYKTNIYHMTLQLVELLEHSQIKHIDEILYHKYLQEEELLTLLNEEEPINRKQLEKRLSVDEEAPNSLKMWGYEPIYSNIKQQALERRGLIKDAFEPLISIIIPSKDNEEVLRICVHSIKKLSSYKNIQLIVIDNGSKGCNRALIKKLQVEYGFEYYYEPMEFNFSKMCNEAAKKATGEYILFLNDDIEVLQEDWLNIMVNQASYPHVGAVGAKLLYPHDQTIQHAGVTNLEIGPAHKLMTFSDNKSYYYGRNRFPYNMIAVTAACLMIEKKKFYEVGTFNESLKIAYNDVEFCFRLYEKGYYQVQRNDVVLYHHESFSRGQDGQSAEKWQRLLKEKHQLYMLHEKLRKNDPFYSKHLIGNGIAYECAFSYDEELKTCQKVELVLEKELEKLQVNESLIIQLDHCAIEKQLDLEETNQAYLIRGWAYVTGYDNARFTKKLMLAHKETGTTYSCKLLTQLRLDAADILQEEINVELSGFVARINSDDMPTGNYAVGICAIDGCSRMKLVNWIGETLNYE